MEGKLFKLHVYKKTSSKWELRMDGAKLVLVNNILSIIIFWEFLILMGILFGIASEFF